MRLTGFSLQRPAHATEQSEFLDWLALAHAESEAASRALAPGEKEDFARRTRRLLSHLGLGPDKIRRRGHVVPDVGLRWEDAELYDFRSHPHGPGFEARSRFFDEAVTGYFEDEYAGVDTPPSELIHVTCTGYVSPSGAQKLVAARGWGALTRVTHAYHMGCYAAFPAVRLAAGSLSMPRALAASDVTPRVDVCHTELCSLHLDPTQHTPEQLLVQCLFADGLIRYSVDKSDAGPGLQILALAEQVLPDSAECMSWVMSRWGMKMTLSRDVPERIAGQIEAFVAGLFARAGMTPKRALYAVHPGGPKIIERVADVLHLEEAQIRASREVLADHGNMSSATLPHVWARLVDDADVASGTPIVSLAFGPGLTVAGGLFRKL